MLLHPKSYCFFCSRICTGAQPRSEVLGIKRLCGMALKNYYKVLAQGFSRICTGVKPRSEIYLMSLIIQGSWRFLAAGQKPKASPLPYDS